MLNLYADIMGGGRVDFSDYQSAQHYISPNVPISWSPWNIVIETDKKTLIYEIIADLKTIEVKEEKKMSSQGKKGNKSRIDYRKGKGNGKGKRGKR